MTQPESVSELRGLVAQAMQRLYRMVHLGRPTDLRDTISAIHEAMVGEPIEPPLSLNRALQWDAYFSIPENRLKPISQMAKDMDCAKSTARFAAKARGVPLMVQHRERLEAGTRANPNAPKTKRPPRPNPRKPRPLAKGPGELLEGLKDQGFKPTIDWAAMKAASAPLEELYAGNAPGPVRPRVPVPDVVEPGPVVNRPEPLLVAATDPPKPWQSRTIKQEFGVTEIGISKEKEKSIIRYLEGNRTLEQVAAQTHVTVGVVEEVRNRYFARPG